MSHWLPNPAWTSTRTTLRLWRPSRHSFETGEPRSESLKVLQQAKKEGVRVTKTSIMLGVGENEEQVLDALKELRKVDVDVVTFGQYMRPTKRHMKVDRYVDPAEFDRWKKVAEDMGFLYVASGPLVRSSYKAGEYFIENVLRGKTNPTQTPAPPTMESSPSLTF